MLGSGLVPSTTQGAGGVQGQSSLTGIFHLTAEEAPWSEEACLLVTASESLYFANGRHSTNIYCQ